MSQSPILSARAAESCRLAARCEFEFITSHFLSPAEQMVFMRSAAQCDTLTANRLFFFGGCEGADRRRAVFVPSYMDLSHVPPYHEIFKKERESAFISLVETMAPDESFGIIPVSVTGSGFASLSHRDYMGSVLGLGMTRDVIGDIAVTGENSAVIFTDEKIAPFIIENLTKVGRDTVKCAPAELPRDFVIPRSFETLHLAAGSDRADSITAAIGGVSRADAKTLCTDGSVEVNYISPVEPDDRVAPGDIISVRGRGKFVIDSFDGETRSGRLKFSVRRYL